LRERGERQERSIIHRLRRFSEGDRRGEKSIYPQMRTDYGDYRKEIIEEGRGDFTADDADDRRCLEFGVGPSGALEKAMSYSFNKREARGV